MLNVVILYTTCLVLASACCLRIMSSMRIQVTCSSRSFLGMRPRLFPPRIWIAWVIWLGLALLASHTIEQAAVIETWHWADFVYMSLGFIVIGLLVLLLSRVIIWCFEKVKSLLTD